MTTATQSCKDKKTGQVCDFGLTLDQCLQQANGAFQMHMCKSQHLTEFNQRFPNAST